MAKIGTAELSTIADFKKIIAGTSAAANGAAADAVSVLYTGNLINGEPAWKAVKALGAASEENGFRKFVFVGDNTDVGRVLNEGEFLNAFREAIDADLMANDPLYSTLSNTKKKAMVKERFDFMVSGVDKDGVRVSNESFWDVASRNFVSEAKGNFRIIAASADEMSVFIQSELPVLLNKPGNITVDGISIEQINKRGDFNTIAKSLIQNSARDMHFTGLSSSNFESFARLTLESRDAYIQDQAKLQEWFERQSLLSPAELADVNSINDKIIDIDRQGGAVTLGHLAGLLAMLAVGYSIYTIARDAQTAKNEGDTDGAAKIIADGIVSLGAGIAIGDVIGALGFGFLGGLAIASPLGLVLGAVIVLGTSIYAGVKGEHMVKELLIKETGALPTVVVENGMKITRYVSGAVVKEAVNPAAEGIDKSWLLPDGNNGMLQIEQNSKTGEQIRSNFLSSNGQLTLLSKEIYTPATNGTVKVETLTYDPVAGTTLSIAEHRQVADGEVLDRVVTKVAADGSATVESDDFNDNTSFQRYNADGKLLVDEWHKADGSHGESAFNPATGGASITVTNADGTSSRLSDDGKGYTATASVDAGGTVTGNVWQKTDGSHGSYALRPDGSSTAIEFKPDQSKTVFTKDADGNQTTVTYDLAGQRTGEYHKGIDGSSSATVFKENGSTESEFKAADGTIRQVRDDGHGNIVERSLDSDRNETGVEWQQADGTRGSQQTDDGVTNGYVVGPDGKNYTRYSKDADGATESASYDSTGKFLGSSWSKPDGTSGGVYRDPQDGNWVTLNKNADGVTQTRFPGDGSIRSTTIHPDGTEARMVDDKSGLRIVTEFGPNGVGVVSNTHMRFNPDGSVTVTRIDAQGRATESRVPAGTIKREIPPNTFPDSEAKPEPQALDPHGAQRDPRDKDPSADPRGEGAGSETPPADNTPKISAEDRAKVKEVERALADAANPDYQEFSKKAQETIVEQRDKAEGIFSTVISPLTLDLDGDGLESLAMAEGVHFDHDANGFIEATGWVAPDDGLLAWDRDGNGLIESGAELFGNFTVLQNGKRADNGFLALAELDANHDGQVNAADTHFAELRIWKDSNSNAKADAGELLPLAQAGVSGIATAYEVSNKVDSRNNEHRQLGQFTRGDGSWGLVHDVWFERDQADPADRPFKPLVQSPSIRELPQMTGMGGMRDLRDAMVLDPTLEAAVRAFVDERSLDQRHVLADLIVQKWTGADKVQIGLDSPHYNERHLFALNVASGTQIYDRNYNERWNAGPQANYPIETGYAAMVNSVYDVLSKQLAARMTLNNLMVELPAVKGDGAEWSMPAYFAKKAVDPKGALKELLEIYRNFGPKIDAAGFDIDALVLQEISSYSSNPDMVAFMSSQHVYAGSGILGVPNGTPDKSILLGLDGNDTLYGSGGKDLLNGGGGGDILKAGTDDVIMFGIGSGHDVIDAGMARSMEVIMGDGVRPEDISVTLERGQLGSFTLVLHLKSGDSLTIPFWFGDGGAEGADPFAVTRIAFGDGTVWAGNDLYQRLPALTDGDDVRSGVHTNDVLDGGAGNDTLSGSYGNDVLLGGSGNDHLQGKQGNDLLIGGAGNDSLDDSDGGIDLLDGGAGNDTLVGGTDSDTYYFGRGSGHDVIDDFTGTATRESDMLILGPGIKPEHLLVRMELADMVIALRGSDDQVRIQGGFQNIGQLLFDDGTLWTTADLMARQLHDAATEENDVVAGTALDEAIDGLGGDDRLEGKAGSDTLAGGAGDDWLEGGGDADVLIGGSGNDTLDGGIGDDTLTGGAGDDALHGSYGNDTYLFGQGHGHDRIYEQVQDEGKPDINTIRLDAAAAAYRFERGGLQKNDLIIRRRNSDDVIEVPQWFSDSNVPLRVEFADGAVWDSETIRAALPTTATSGNDKLYGGDAAELLAGAAGNDWLYGRGGNDTLDGGAGNDTLHGGDGDDTYLFGYGGGQDHAVEFNGGGNDTIRMAPGVRPQDVSFVDGTTGRLIRLAGSDDSISISLNGDEKDRIERLEFADGTVWDLMANPNGPITQEEYSYDPDPLDLDPNQVKVFKGTNLNDVVQGSSGKDELKGGSGNDTLRGGAGDDQLIGEGGFDVLDGGEGNDVNAADEGDRVLFGYGSGHDQLYRPYDSVGVLAFAPGVGPDDVLLRAGQYGSLQVRLRGADDGIDIAYWFSRNESAQSFTFEFADGTRWSVEQIRARLSAQGNSGDDYMYGTEADDVLAGGAGNDTMTGGDHDNEYRFAPGFGKDTIKLETNLFTAGDHSRIVMGEGILARNIIVTGDNPFTPGSTANLYLSVFGTTDRLTLTGWFLQPDLDTTVEFADGTVWTRRDLLQHYYALERGGAMAGSELADKLNGDSTPDHIEGMEGDDTISGGAGDDELLGNAGDDVLDGGSGNDALFGGVGDDTYVFERGFGQDDLADFDRAGGGHDRIEFGAGIAAGDVVISRTPSDIVLSLKDSTDRLAIRWYGNAGLRIEEVRFADGTTWSGQQLQEMADDAVTLRGIAGDDVLNGDTHANRILGEAGNDKLSGLDGDDYLAGGAGNDQLDGGKGSDVLNGGAGNDTLDGGLVGDEMAGNEGNDVYVVDQPDDRVLEEAGEGDDTVMASVDYALADEVEHLRLTGEARYGAGNALANTLTGNAAGNALFGGAGNDTLTGLAGDDELLGEAGADVITGGVGADRLDGGAGDDVYLYARGDGNDQIRAGSALAGNGDTLRFAAGISAADVSVSKDADYGHMESKNNLYLDIAGSGERITLSHWLDSDGGSRVERIEFADGTVWNEALLQQKAGLVAAVPRSTAGDDLLEGSLIGDDLYGLGGNDTLRGLDGDDVLDGGTGDDMLDGGVGNDVYLFGRGDGADVITDTDDKPDNVDAVRLAAGIAVTDVKGRRDGDALFLDITGGTDQLVLLNWFRSEADRIERIEFADGTVWDAAYVQERFGGHTAYPAGTDGDDVYAGSDAGDAYDGLGGNDILYGNGGDDSLDGGMGGDLIAGGDGNDSLNGGIGLDTLLGGAGNDVYHYQRGDGQDVLVDSDETAGNVDTVQFGEGIAPADVSVKLNGSALALSLSDTDMVLMNNWLTSAGRIEKVAFADGTVWGMSEILAHQDASTEGDDVLAGGNAAVLRGLGGNDLLYGLDSADTLDGGAGDDQLFGGTGNDVYLFGRGAGQDYVSDYDSTEGNADTVRFAASVLPADVKVSRTVESLILHIAGTEDSITLQDWFADPAARVERVEFADGTHWDAAQLVAKLPGASAGDDFLVDDGNADTLDGLAGNDQLYGLGGGDALSGGSGDDMLSGGDGNDTMEGGAGNDELYGDAGHDTYIYTAGDGQDTIYDHVADIADPTDADLIRLRGIAAADVTVARDETILYLQFKDGGRIGLGGWFEDAVWQAKQVRFDDGTVWHTADLLSRLKDAAGEEPPVDEAPVEGLPPVSGTANGDHFAGTGGNDVYDGLAGDDVIEGGAGHDHLAGGSGNDEVHGGAGNDTLIGGAGDDELHGGAGNDVYRFAIGDGRDALLDDDGIDTVRFGAGIAPEDIRLELNGHLSISVGSAGDMLVLVNWQERSQRIERLVFDDGTVWNADTMLAHLPAATDGDDLLMARDAGGALHGLGGNDLLLGQGGNDTLEGGAGDDRLLGGAGNDVYLFSQGDGTDVIYEDQAQPGDVDTVRFDASVAVADVHVSRTLEALLLDVAGNGGRIELGEWFTRPDGVGRVEFANGTVWDRAQLTAMLPGATAGDDVLVAEADGGTLDGGNGNDLLYGLEGSDTLLGGAGDDRMEAGMGDDVLEGGAGGDELYGDAGADRYDFKPGDGRDTIFDAASEPGEIDTVRLHGIAPAAVKVGRDSHSMYLTFDGSNDRIGLDYWFEEAGFQAKQVVFDDGTVWGQSALADRLDLGQAGSAGADLQYGGDGADVFAGLGGSDILTGDGGNDVLQGGDGADRLNDQAGRNLLDGGAGDDALDGGGNWDAGDVMAGGQGNDWISAYSGANVILFNRGDGQDEILAGPNSKNTVSLGQGISYADLLFRKSGDDLELLTGNGESLRFTGWYADDDSNGVSTLQMVVDTGSDYDAGAADPLRRHKVASFDFAGLVGAFDQARAAAPALTSWSLSSALLDFHLGGSDTAAIGGDLAYRYAQDGNFASLSQAPAQALLADGQLGRHAQALQPAGALQDLSPRLM